MARRRPIVTLTTDVGSAYAAQMKAVLYRSLPPGHVVDLVHDLPAHRIEEAAFLLEHLAAGFPAGTIHVAVVDPGVGGGRAPIAIQCREGSHLLGPDNGLLAPLARRLGIRAVVRLSVAKVRPGRAVSPTFEGRDLFAPAAVRLSEGTPIRRLGTAWTLHDYEAPSPALGPRVARGHVLHIDHFGNAITNIPSDWAPDGTPLTMVRAGRSIRLTRLRTYADLRPGRIGIIGSSFGVLEVCAREARAADRLHLEVGSRVDLRRGGRAARDRK